MRFRWLLLLAMIAALITVVSNKLRTFQHNEALRAIAASSADDLPPATAHAVEGNAQ